MALYIFIFIFIIHNLYGNYLHIINLLNAYEITLKVVTSITTNILHSSYACPSQVYLNGKIQNLSDCHSIQVDDIRSEIKMVWNGPINSTYYMFHECIYINDVDLTNFDTSLVTNMEYMFYCCHSLTSINLSNLNTKNVKKMYNMFNHCYILVSINLGNFDTSMVNNMTQLFARSSLLEYINIKNFKETNNLSISGMFSNVKENAVICLNSIKSPNIYNLAKKLSCVTFSCETDWRRVQKNLTNCNDKNETEFEEKEIQDAREGMKNLDSSDVEKQDIIKSQKDYTMTFSNSDNQKNGNSSNTTNIDLGACEDRIKQVYNIPKNKSLLIFKLDVMQEGIQIPKIDYEVYYPLYGGENIKLDLSLCSNLKIDIKIPAIASDNIDKNNEKSGFYNDLCYTYTSDNKTDVTLSDRQKDFLEKNLALCEEGCDLVDYDKILNKSECSCFVKTNSTFEIKIKKIDIKQAKKEFFKTINNFANIKVLTCYKLIFTLEAYKSNYANLVLIAIILLLIISIIIFYCKDFPSLKKIMNMIVFLKMNKKLVKKIINKKENKIIRKRDFVQIKTIIGINTKKSKKLNRDKKKKKHHKFSELNIQTIKIKTNPIKKRKKKLNNSISNNLTTNNNTTNNNNTFAQMNLRFSEKQIYKMAMKINYPTDLEMNTLIYEKAIKSDNRTFCMYFVSLVRTNHLLFFSFMNKFDFNSRTLKIFLFFFNFTVNFITNAFFLTEKKIEKIHEKGGFFDFIYNIPQIVSSAIISGIINSLTRTFALSDSIFTRMKKEKNKNIIFSASKKYISTLKIKFIFFLLISLALLVLFWLYLSCFCAVYKNTQMYLIKDTLSSFAFSLVYPFGLYLIPAIFRIYALKGKKRNLMYKLSKVIQLFV